MRLNVDVDMGKTKNMVVSLLRLDGAKRGLRTAGLYVHGVAREYAEQPASVEYKRTGNLRDRWTSTPSRDGLSVTAGNNATYADDVQGRQAGNPYFRRIWRDHSIKAVVRKTRKRATDIVQNEVRRSIRT